jgi:DNA-directed RNA polymerase II subunit RPB2
MQELDENADLILDQADQHTDHYTDMTYRYTITFDQIYLSRPIVTEADGSVVPVFPQEVIVATTKRSSLSPSWSLPKYLL